MPVSADLMRNTLLLCMLAMALLTVFYLRQRNLPPWAYAVWGLIAILVPIFGPFFVIWMQPGSRRYQPHP